MWMEPDELPPPEFSVVRSESRVVREYSAPVIQNGFKPITNPSTHNYPSALRAQQQQPEHYNAPESAAQNFFPSYFRNSPQLSGHSRPYTASTPNSASAIAGRYSATGGRTAFDQSILGKRMVIID